MPAQFLPDILHILRLADKGGRHIVKVLLRREPEVLPVLFRQRRQMDMYVGDVDAFVVGENAPVLHLTVDLRPSHLFDQQIHQSVVHQDVTAGLHFVCQVLIGH